MRKGVAFDVPRCDFCGKRARVVLQPDGWRICERCNRARRSILKEIVKK